jgi:hypothetical protein
MLTSMVSLMKHQFYSVRTGQYVLGDLSRDPSAWPYISSISLCGVFESALGLKNDNGERVNAVLLGDGQVFLMESSTNAIRPVEMITLDELAVYLLASVHLLCNIWQVINDSIVAYPN